MGKFYSKLVEKGIKNGEIIRNYKKYITIPNVKKTAVLLIENEDFTEIDEFERNKIETAINACVAKNDFGMKCNQEKSQVSFVKDCLNRDLSYFRFLICAILEDYDDLHLFKAYDADLKDRSTIWSRINDFIVKDEMEIISKWESFNKYYDYSNMVLAPYDPTIELLEVNTDAYTEYLNGKLTLFQIALFHEYIIRYLAKRFEEYRYLPANILRNDNCLTSVYHKGFDILFAIAVNLELQLGVHLVFQNAFSGLGRSVEADDSWFKKISMYFSKEKYKRLSLGTQMIMNSYLKTIDLIMENYNPYIEFNAVYKSNRMYEEEIRSLADIVYMNLPQGNGYFLDYKNSLRAMCVGLLCGNEQTKNNLFKRSLQLCTQMDYLKMLEGITKAESVFNSGQNAQWSRKEYIKRYHEAVFYLFDEKNGINYGNYPSDLTYVDVDDYDALKDENGYYRKNPSFRERFYYNYSHIRVETFEMLGGTCFTWRGKDGSIKGIYPLIPFYAENNFRIPNRRQKDKTSDAIGESFANKNDIEKIEDRQEYLGFVKEIDEIPVACFREYMTAPVFYNWLEQKESLVIIKQQNEQLEQTNDSLSRHIELNTELVRALSHSSANYLNSDKLAKTGYELYTADRDNPTIEELHYDGLLLLLQSEHETFLRRRLDSLVIRCSADVYKLKRSIREGLSIVEGVTISSPLDFAVRTIISRIVTRDDDIRSKAIREKFNKTDDEWLILRADFIRSVLANGKSALWWCNTNLCVINYTSSSKWKKTKILEERPLFDLIVEILSEQLMNAFSHGNLKKEIKIVFGEADTVKRKGILIPTWYYIQMINVPGEVYKGGRHTGIETLDSTMLLLNENKRGVEVSESIDRYEMTVWFEADLLRTL